jgi:hypothetical protein
VRFDLLSCFEYGGFLRLAPAVSSNAMTLASASNPPIMPSTAVQTINENSSAVMIVPSVSFTIWVLFLNFALRLFAAVWGFRVLMVGIFGASLHK